MEDAAVSKLHPVAAPSRDCFRQPSASELVRPPSPAGIAHKQGLAALCSVAGSGEDNYPHNSEDRCKHHVTPTDSSEGKVNGEKHRDHKNICNNFQEIRVDQSNEIIALK